MKLEIKQLTKCFGRQKVINNVNLLIPDSKSIALIGPSGSGKSTLLKLIAGLVYPTQGSIALDDKEIIFEEKALRLHRMQIGIVFQSWNLFPI